MHRYDPIELELAKFAALLLGGYGTPGKSEGLMQRVGDASPCDDRMMAMKVWTYDDNKLIGQSSE